VRCQYNSGNDNLINEVLHKEVKELSDEELVLRFKKGDTSSFIFLVNRHKKGLYGMVYRILRSQADAEDLTQEIFLKVYENIHGFREESSFKTWLYRIGINQVSNHRKSGKYNREILNETLLQINDCQQPEIIEKLIEKDYSRLLSAAIDSLPPKQKMTLSLRVDKDLKNREIAEILDCPLGTVKANLFHAINHIKSTLKKNGFEFQ
jgi:RNA polymerase sigma-70 factor, ECF subfamily